MKTGLILAFVLVIGVVQSFAKTCEGVIIASYNGEPRSVGNIFEEQQSLKFVNPNWPKEKILQIERAFDWQFVTEQFHILTVPCDSSVWVYPFPGDPNWRWVKVGKLKRLVRNEDMKFQKEEDKPETLKRSLFKEIGIGLVSHIIILAIFH